MVASEWPVIHPQPPGAAGLPQPRIGDFKSTWVAGPNGVSQSQSCPSRQNRFTSETRALIGNSTGPSTSYWGALDQTKSTLVGSRATPGCLAADALIRAMASVPSPVPLYLQRDLCEVLCKSVCAGAVPELPPTKFARQEGRLPANRYGDRCAPMSDRPEPTFAEKVAYCHFEQYYIDLWLPYQRSANGKLRHSSNPSRANTELRQRNVRSPSVLASPA